MAGPEKKGLFDDLIPQPGGLFDDLIPQQPAPVAPAVSQPNPVASADPRVSKVLEMAAKAEAAGDPEAAARFRASAEGAMSTAAPEPVFQDQSGQRTVFKSPEGDMNYVDEESGYSTTDEEFILRLINGEDPQAITQSKMDRDLDAAAQNVPAPLRFLGNMARGVGKGLTGLAGLPADMISAVPTIPNLAPGEQGFKSLTQMYAEGELQPPEVNGFWDAVQYPMDKVAYELTKPVPDPNNPDGYVPAWGSASFQNMGAEAADAVGLGDSPAFRPVGMADRFAGRIGEEIGFTGPALGMALKRAATAAPGVISDIAKRLMGKEAALAAAAGATAQGANEMFTPEGAEPGSGTPTSDFVGSLIGGLGLPMGSGLAKALGRVTAGIGGGTRFLDDVASRRVRDVTLDNSNAAQEFVAQGGDITQFDTTGMVDQLRTETALEDAIPGYTATAGERMQDPAFRTFEQGLESSNPALQNVRKEANNAAVNARVGELAPAGDPGAFRSALDSGIETATNAAQSAAAKAKELYDTLAAKMAVSPDSAPAAVRGATIRDGLSSVYESGKKRISDMFAQIEGSGAQVDVAGLKNQFDNVGLTANDAARFMPTEKSTLDNLINFDEAGNITPSFQPVNEVMSLRSGLSSDIRATNEPQRARVAGVFTDEIDGFLENVLPPEQLELYRAARAERADLGKRFEEPDGVGRVLEETGRSTNDQPLFRMADERVPGTLVPNSDAGAVTDYGKMMKEAGSNPSVRDAVADTVRVRASKFLDDPMRMAGFIENNKIVLSDFPDLKADLEAAGASRATLAAAEKASANVSKSLAPGGNTPEGQYTRYGAEDSARSMETVLASDRPDEAARALLDRAGRSPEAVTGARTAFWDLVSNKGKNSASINGSDVWNPRKTADYLHDPKVEAAAKELWGEDIADFEALRGIFDQLEAATPGRLNAAGSSGTAQAMQVSRGASLTPSRISADLRAIGQNRTSPVQVGVQWISDILRTRSADKQQEWINSLMRASVNEPGVLANILEKYNPVVESATDVRISQIAGVRGTAVGALLEDLTSGENPEDEDSEMNDAIWEKN